MATGKLKQALKILVEQKKIERDYNKLENKISFVPNEELMDEKQNYMAELIEKSGSYGIKDLEKYKK
jgi:hypothetical protein|tara:strand:+ start:100 stop:300 length:201 start_codon:yes stop_codon:yes gene_type:complete